MANEINVFSKFELIDQVGRQFGFDMDRPEYRGKMYVDASDYIVQDGLLKPEEVTPEIVSAYVCDGLKRVELLRILIEMDGKLDMTWTILE